MRGLEEIILILLDKLHSERSLKGAFYILQGKKSGQAIQDAAIFELEEWFGFYPSLSMDIFSKHVTWLENERLIIISSNGSYSLTAKGINYIENLKQQVPVLFIKRGRHKHVGYEELKLFWAQVVLLSQMLSSYLHQQKSYVPIIKEHQVQELCKIIWQAYEDKQQLAVDWLADIQTLFKRLEQSPFFTPPELFQHLLLDRLPGAFQSGQNLHQLAQKYNLKECLVHAMLQQIAKEWFILHKSQQLKVLSSSTDLISTVGEGLTQSTKLTYELLLQGADIDEISRVRGLKRNTIEDHLVELASKGLAFNLSRFIEPDLLLKVKEVQQKLQTKKLRLLKQALSDEVSYLQIRLALVTGDVEIED